MLFLAEVAFSRLQIDNFQCWLYQKLTPSYMFSLEFCKIFRTALLMASVAVFFSKPKIKRNTKTITAARNSRIWNVFHCSIDWIIFPNISKQHFLRAPMSDCFFKKYFRKAWNLLLFSIVSSKMKNWSVLWCNA